MIIDMFDIAGANNVLTGAVNGKSAFAELVCNIRPVKEPQILYMEFSRVEIATASFLRESIFEFKKYVRSSSPDIYPVVANANEIVVEEILLIAEARNAVMVACVLNSAGDVEGYDLIGTLDPKQKLTLNLVEASTGIDARQLMQKHKEESVTTPTAWNNRLAGLAAHGVVRVFSEGRSKVYHPLFGVN